MICSECGGNIQSPQHLVYRPDGGRSGIYKCEGCGKTKEFKTLNSVFIKDSRKCKKHNEHYVGSPRGFVCLSCESETKDTKRGLEE